MKKRMMIENMIRIFAGLVLLAGLSACGFHLRGKIELPEELNVVYIKSTEHWLKYQIGSALKTSGSKVITRPDGATAVLEIHKVSFSRSVKSVGALGRAREYILVYTVRFSIRTADKRVLLKPTTVSRSRVYSFNEAEVVGKAVEERIILRELKREVVPDIMLHVSSINRKPHTDK